MTKSRSGFLEPGAGASVGTTGKEHKETSMVMGLFFILAVGIDQNSPNFTLKMHSSLPEPTVSGSLEVSTVS